ncbi:MAG: SDR family NAD(P)-dependent oxidoreductase [Candidatus Thiodiazotropha sp. (ex. Lucinisca nassula)]|nr:SDR family NAD(P)-dependent oxidoreductase [Candidatus Thiodiazotropha sp. (ex. Lucinisca nassula)]
MEIGNTTVVVTGASSGIGAELSVSMALAGAAELVLLARNEVALNEVARKVEAVGSRARIYSIDLSDVEAVKTVSGQIRNQMGSPDILINNAGIGQWKYLQDTRLQEIENYMAVPYLAAAWMTAQFLPAMLERGSGHIVNISSVASRLAWPGATAYIASCRAMRGLSDALRADLKRTNIRISHYESGPVESPYWSNNPQSRERVPGVAKLLLPVLSEEKAVHAIVKGITGNKRFIVPSTMLRLIYLLHSAFPWLVQGLMTGTGSRLSSRTVNDY